MPAIQEKEKAFQSMQDSLDKIEKNTSSLGSFTGTLEAIMEENKAQRLRDKEQEKQTKALEKMSGKDAKEGMATWKKVLLAGLAVGVGIWAIHDLMKGFKWPWEKEKDRDSDINRENIEKAIKKATTKEGLKEAGRNFRDDHRYQKNWLTEMFGIDPGGTREDVVASIFGTEKLAGIPQNVREQATRIKKGLGNAWKNWKPGVGEKWQRGKERFQRFKAGFVMPEAERENARGNKARETLGKANKIRQNLLDIENKNRKAQNQATETKVKNEAKATRQQNIANKTEQNRLKNINQTKGSLPGSSSVTKQVVSQARFPLGADGKPRVVDPFAKGKGGVRTAISYLGSLAKGRAAFAIGTTATGGNIVVGLIAGISVTAADIYAQTPHGQEFIEALGFKGKEKEFKDIVKAKIKGAKSFTGAPLDAARIPKKQVDSMEGKLSTGTGTSDPLSKIGSNIKKRFTKLSKFLWGKEDKPLVLKMTKPYSGTDDESLTDADYKAMKIGIGKRESEGAEGGPLRAKNKYGYRGKYQFGAQALESIGFLKAGTWKKGPRDNKKLMENSSNWIGGTDKDGNPLPKSLNAYLSSEEMQDLAFHKNALFNRKVMRGKGGIGMETWNSLSKEERAFMVGAAHISGAQSTVSQFNRGDFGKTDAFGTPSSEMGLISARAVNQTGQALQSIRAEMGGTGSNGAITIINQGGTQSSNTTAVVVPTTSRPAPIETGLLK